MLFFWGGTLHSSVEQNPADDNTNDAGADGTDGAGGTDDADGTDDAGGTDGAGGTNGADGPRYWVLFVDPLVVDDLQTRVATVSEPIAEDRKSNAECKDKGFPPIVIECDGVAGIKKL